MTVRDGVLTVMKRGEVMSLNEVMGRLDSTGKIYPRPRIHKALLSAERAGQVRRAGHSESRWWGKPEVLWQLTGGQQ